MQHGQDDLNAKLNTFKNLNDGVAKNVILFLGDGMGFSTVASSRIYKGQQNGKAGEETKFSFEEFPVTGISRVRRRSHFRGPFYFNIDLFCYVMSPGFGTDYLH